MNKLFDRYMRTLKGSLLMRLLVWPYMIYKKKTEYIAYQNSVDSLKIKSFKDIHKGQRCFIIGNGSSLRTEDLEKLQNEITMASNRIYNIFEKTTWRPMYYFSVDRNGMEEIASIILNSNIDHVFLDIDAKKYLAKSSERITYILGNDEKYVINIYNDKSSHISEDISKYFSRGYSTPFTMIQFAIYAGINEIYLLGVDFNYSLVSNKWGRIKKVDGVIDYFDKRKYKGSFLNYYSVLYAFEHAKKYCDEHNIKIMNATRGGKLEVFERINFDMILKTISN